jgi:serine phosphatase RsbU (regulator of sigma subunit)
VRPAQEPGEGAQRSVGWILLLVAPGLWVMAVVGLGFVLHMGVQLIPLLAAAPAIACAGTGRRLCVALGSTCALIALTPIPGQPIAVGERISSASAVLTVTLASYLVAHRRIRMQQAYDEVRQIAEVTQRVLLRPIPERIGPVATAVEYLSAAIGARVGGDFYEVIDTPYGVRAILGDMRGHGLDAVSGAAALLGAFREAGAVEPTLEAVAARLDAALTRHTAGSRRAEIMAGRRDEKRGTWGELGVRADEERQLWTEDFATAVLVQVPHGGSAGSSTGDGAGNGARDGAGHGGSAGDGAGHGGGVGDGAGYGGDVGEGAGHGGSAGEGAGHGGGVGDGAGHGGGVGDGAGHGGDVGDGAGHGGGVGVQRWHGVGANEAKLVVCGHPAPYLVRDGLTLPIASERPTLPLGLGWLVDEPYAASSKVVPFEPGDALVFYTDGVSDARDRSGEFFQLEGLLCDGLYGRAPRVVAATVRSRLLEHAQHELNDDAALLVLARLGGDD